ncbi:MAG TPA: hypothetical protein VFJ24_03655, partial [Gaiellales bacterium]|nr:hypothetical protein [Gaiellales bacterium]
MTQHEGKFGVFELAVGNVQVGATHAAGVDAQQDFAVRRMGVGDGVVPEQPAGSIQERGAHSPLRLQPGRRCDKGGLPSQATL